MNRDRMERAWAELAQPEATRGTLVPVPDKVRIKSWFRHYDLSYIEAEAWHLRKAADLVGESDLQMEHLREAALNRYWRFAE